MEQIAVYEKKDRVYVDESGIDSYIHKPFGWAEVGTLIYGEASGKRYARESFVAAKCGSQILALLCFQGTCNMALFDMWVEAFLVPALKPGQVVVLDNATFHKSEKTRRLIESAGCALLFFLLILPTSIRLRNSGRGLKLKLEISLKMSYFKKYFHIYHIG